MAENYSSFSNFQEILIEHAKIELLVSFSPQKIVSKVTYSMRVLVPAVSLIVLDTRKLDVKGVTPGMFEFGNSSPGLGTPLKITLPEPKSQGEVLILTIDSECGNDSLGLVWMRPEQTSGKVHPFLFSQFEPIHCRTIFPIQDSPNVKFPIDFEITVPDPLKAVTAAEQTGSRSSIPGFTTFLSSQSRPLPSYLIAFAVGNLASRDIGPRSKVFAEPEVVDSAAWEFAGTEEMLATAERLLTPYEWGKYDLLVLPPSFPYGGMENPTLTFVTPTVLAGDRSLVSVIAHEICHSWAGNLVTNRTWEHFWLNEGLTTFLELKVMRALQGPDAADIMLSADLKSLEDSVNSKMTGNASEETRLKTVYGDRNPDDYYSSVPYFKGMCCFAYLESAVGGSEVFLGFLREYFHRFAFKSVNSLDLRDLFQEKFPGIDIDWDRWLYGIGLPPYLPPVQLSVLPAITSLVQNFQDVSYNPKSSDIANWPASQICLFLRQIQLNPLPQHLLMSSAYGFSATRNYEVKFYWLLIVICLKAKQFYGEVRDMLSSQGRGKYVRPLFKLLGDAQEKEIAREIFERNKEFYSPIIVRLLLEVDAPWLKTE